MNHYELHYPLCKNEIMFLFTDHNIVSNLPSVCILYYLKMEEQAETCCKK